MYNLEVLNNHLKAYGLGALYYWQDDVTKNLNLIITDLAGSGRKTIILGPEHDGVLYINVSKYIHEQFWKKNKMIRNLPSWF